MTSWGLLLLVAFVVLGVSGTVERTAYRRAVALTAVVLLAVGIGVL